LKRAVKRAPSNEFGDVVAEETDNLRSRLLGCGALAAKRLSRSVHREVLCGDPEYDPPERDLRSLPKVNLNHVSSFERGHSRFSIATSLLSL
jgi:hypothetical protein